MNNTESLQRVSKPDHLRFEVKMVCEEPELPVLRSKINLHPAAFRAAYPERQINSIYFETEDHGCLWDHLGGSPERWKIRLRWYGEELKSAADYVIETKMKNNRGGGKLREDFKGKSIALASKSWKGILSGLRGGCDFQIRSFLDRVSRPAVLISYKREYYVTSCGRVRLTIDKGLKKYSQLYRQTPNLVFAEPLTDKCVIEWKADIEHEEFLQKCMSDFPLRITAFSKYLNASLDRVSI
ncbi:MAG: VTC domain-containing protein [Planctomycetota bacterium]|jgi:hypothetical protein